MSKEQQSIKVNIFGSEYAIRGDADEDYIQSLARYLNEKMNEIAQSTHLTSPLKISILAGINLADEIFRLRSHLQPNPQPKERAEKSGPRKRRAAEAEPDIAPEAISALSQHIQNALDEE